MINNYSFFSPGQDREYYVQRLTRNDLYYVVEDGGRRIEDRLKSGGHGTAEAAQRTLELMAAEYGWERGMQRR